MSSEVVESDVDHEAFCEVFSCVVLRVVCWVESVCVACSLFVVVVDPGLFLFCRHEDEPDMVSEFVPPCPDVDVVFIHVDASVARVVVSSCFFEEESSECEE